MTHKEKCLPIDLVTVRYINRFPYNRPFPIWFEPHYESEACYIVLVIKISLIYMQTKLIFT